MVGGGRMRSTHCGKAGRGRAELPNNRGMTSMSNKQKRQLGLHRGQLLPCVAAMSLGWSLCAHAKATYTTFDPPDSEQTEPTSISNGVITGYYYNGPAYGFVRAPDGTITTFAPTASVNTFANAINGTGAITGYYVDNSNASHGFLRSVDGTITSLDVKQADNTEAWSISDKGEIAGLYYDGSLQPNGCWNQCHAFLRNAKGRIITFEPSGSTDSWSSQINDHGVVAGGYIDGSQVQHGFVRTPDGTIMTFDPPGSTLTYTATINNKGAIAGSYFDAAGQHAYVRAADGTFTTIDIPQCSNGLGVSHINDRGWITGWCDDAQSLYQGFVRKPDGKVKLIDPEGSSGAYAYGIDDLFNVTGYYGGNGGVHGFLWSR
jgi:hypothetical protein